MADYYPLISEAIADKKTNESRREFYDRARAILADHCRKADPPLSDAFCEQERRALEEAISKVEADVMDNEGTPLIPNELQTSSDHAEDSIRLAAKGYTIKTTNTNFSEIKDNRQDAGTIRIIYKSTAKDFEPTLANTIRAQFTTMRLVESLNDGARVDLQIQLW